MHSYFSNLDPYLFNKVKCNTNTMQKWIAWTPGKNHRLWHEGKISRPTEWWFYSCCQYDTSMMDLNGRCGTSVDLRWWCPPCAHHWWTLKGVVTLQGMYYHGLSKWITVQSHTWVVKMSDLWYWRTYYTKYHTVILWYSDLCQDQSRFTRASAFIGLYRFCTFI